jgi:hypothetical protein
MALRAKEKRKMKVSEMIERIKSLVGEDDVDVFLDVKEGEFGFRGDFNIYLDADGDLNVRF